MDIDRIWRLASNLTIFELSCLGALLFGVLVSALFAIYMYGGLLAEEVQKRRARSIRRKAWIENTHRR